MERAYSSLIQNIRNRANPDNIILEKAFTDELTASYNDILKYISYAMRGVEPEYTKNSKLAGERVQEHLKTTLENVVYKYQGSVMTNTHIRGNSDIDLLVITDKFYTFDRVGIQNILNNYYEKSRLATYQIQRLENELQGGGYSSALDDLRNNRLKSERKMSDVYELCDITHAKAIKITNKNLRRDVDIVIANWYDDVNSVISNKDSDFRGSQVYNKDFSSKGNPDYPFLSIKRINEKSSETNGRLKKMIRFLKNVKADSTKDIKLSSFDINAICYDIDINSYRYLDQRSLVVCLYQQLYSLYTNVNHSNNLKSVDEHEYIFKDKQDKLDSLKVLQDEVASILIDLRPYLS